MSDKFKYTVYISIIYCAIQLLEDKIKEIPIKSINHYNMIDDCKNAKVDLSPSKAPTTAISATN